MNISEAFPGRFVRAEDLGGEGARITVTIDRCEMVDTDLDGDTSKPALYFAGKDKALILNKTNAASLTRICGGTDTDAWRGQQIALYVTTTWFDGRNVACIRIAPAEGAPAAAAPPVVAPEEIPF